MPLHILMGDDEFAISQTIAAYKAKLDPAWFAVSYHSFDYADMKDKPLQAELKEISAVVRTLPLSDLKLVVIRNLDSTGLDLSHLSWIDRIPDPTTVVLHLAKLDRRTKLAKALIKLAKPQELNLPSPWQEEQIKAGISRQAASLGLVLSNPTVQYLGDALGNDRLASQSALQKIKLYSPNPTQAEVEQLVPNHNQTVWQLAAAVRDNQPSIVIHLVEAMFNAHPMELVAPVLAQFKTWTTVKAGLSQKLPDAELAQLAKLGNPKRLYYLRQEVEPLSLTVLVQKMSRLAYLDTVLKQGQSNRMLPELVAIAQLALHN